MEPGDKKETTSTTTSSVRKLVNRSKKKRKGKERMGQETSRIVQMDHCKRSENRENEKLRFS